MINFSAFDTGMASRTWSNHTRGWRELLLYGITNMVESYQRLTGAALVRRHEHGRIIPETDGRCSCMASRTWSKHTRSWRELLLCACDVTNMVESYQRLTGAVLVWRHEHGRIIPEADGSCSCTASRTWSNHTRAWWELLLLACEGPYW